MTLVSGGTATSTAAGTSAAQFAQHVRYYLTQSPRQLPSRYLYDALGSALFDAICELPWYGVTRSEMRLLQSHASEILGAMRPLGRIIELGAGNGRKLETLLASIPPYWAPFIAVFHTRMGNPSTPAGKALLQAASPLTHVAKIKRPLLIGQGANDPRVKQAESEQIVAAMKKHGLPVTYALFPDEGHGFKRPENNIAFIAITEAFLSAHLGGNYLPITTEELKATSMKINEGKSGIPGLAK